MTTPFSSTSPAARDSRAGSSSSTGADELAGSTREKRGGKLRDPRAGTCFVLASRATPPEYLATLRREHVPYLVAGEDRVEFKPALQKLKTLLSVECVLCTAPGKLGGALLAAGLVGEINVLWLPIVVGGTDTPTLFESPDLGPGERPAQLSLISCETCSRGTALARHRVDARRGEPR